ncbi:MAG: NAD(P)/FAD-dependent oxidoreductase, partial [Chitinophagales bacterium]|nr:NAD(P)/FAD-dependent oxidoreductase [Chitinophagales bacterium]
RKLAKNILFKINNKPMQPFYYKDKGNMATVGRNKAVAEIGKLKLGGFSGWLIWMLLHLILLIGFRNKIVVLINWVWNYINYDRHIRLIIRPYRREF